MMCDLRVNISQKMEIKGPVFVWARAVKERASVWQIAADGAEPLYLADLSLFSEFCRCRKPHTGLLRPLSDTVHPLYSSKLDFSSIIL